MMRDLLVLNHPSIDQVDLVVTMSYMVFKVLQFGSIGVVFLHKSKGVLCLTQKVQAIANVLKMCDLNIMLTKLLFRLTL